MSLVIEYPVFRDDRGNRFIFPNVCTSNNPMIGMTEAKFWPYCRQLVVALRVVEEKYRFAAEVDSYGFLNFTRIVADALHQGFFFGGSEVWIIGGPKFDIDNP